MWLVHNGVPYDVALLMPEVERVAHSIIFAKFQGRVFDWDRMVFKDPE